MSTAVSVAAPAAASAVVPPVVLTGPGGRCRSSSGPARATRVGAPPRPRLRPLGDVLAELVRSAPTPEPAAVEPARATPAPAPSEDPRTRAVVVRLLQAVVEVLDGTRPVGHLRHVCDEAAYASVVALAVRTGATRGRLRGVRVCPVTCDAVEAAAVVHRDGRARALAARLEHDGRDWRFTVLAIL